MKAKSDKCVVIVVGSRFFYGYGKNKQVKTAWCLSGAQTYQTLDCAQGDIDFIRSKGKLVSVFLVGLELCVLRDEKALREGDREAGEAQKFFIDSPSI
jgi:hypothetical protein